MSSWHAPLFADAFCMAVNVSGLLCVVVLFGESGCECIVVEKLELWHGRVLGSVM